VLVSSFETNQVITGEEGEEEEEEGLNDSVVPCVSFIFLCILRHCVNTRAFIQTSVAAVFLFTAKAASQCSGYHGIWVTSRKEITAVGVTFNVMVKYRGSNAVQKSCDTVCYNFTTSTWWPSLI